MNSLRNRIERALAAAAVLFSCQLALAQAAAPVSPEPGDAPVAEKVEVSPGAPVETATVTGATAEAPEAAKSAGPDTKRIAQRVDGASTDEIIRITPKPKKNVYRIDNKPNRPKVTPIAVIKGPVSPWGYASRYSGGQVDRPAARDLQGSAQGPGLGRNQQNLQQGARPNTRGASASALGGRAGKRGKESR